MSEEQIGPSKAEAKAELRRLMEESRGKLFAKGRPYPEWMERVPFPAGYKSPDLPTFKGTGLAKQLLWHFTMRTSKLIENDAQRVMLFASTLEGLPFDWFERLLEGSTQIYHDLKVAFEKSFQEDTHRVTRRTLTGNLPTRRIRKRLWETTAVAGHVVHRLEPIGSSWHLSTQYAHEVSKILCGGDTKVIR